MKGMLFKPDMIKAIVEGRKTVTRRIIKPQPELDLAGIWDWQPRKNVEIGWKTIYDQSMLTEYARYQVGETVYIKEAWCQDWDMNGVTKSVVYKAKAHPSAGFKWVSPLFMPAWAARYFIKITDVRAEKLWEITEEDAQAEGLKAQPRETWWQGYREVEMSELGKELMHQQTIGEDPPDWMIEPHKMLDRPDLEAMFSAQHRFFSLWNSINKPPYDWQSNPFVWVISFEKA